MQVNNETCGLLAGLVLCCRFRQWPRLWGEKVDGAIGGGVITYTADNSQKVAAAVGFTSILWPTEPTTGKIVVVGLGANSASQ